MEMHYPTIKTPATPKYVLSVLRDWHRQTFYADHEMAPRNLLTFTTTVEEWRIECDLVSWRPLGRAMNEVWKMSLSDLEWRDVLQPEKSKTLWDVCSLIATHASTPLIREVTLLGKICRPASAFLTIRSILCEAGADSSSIGPSTPLVGYTQKYANAFSGPITMLAPEALPNVRVVKNLSYEFIDKLLMVITAILFYVLILSLLKPLLMIIVLILICFALWSAKALEQPPQIYYGDLCTFRDLSMVIANHATMR